MTNFDVGNGERGRKWRENEEMEKEGGNGERRMRKCRCYAYFVDLPLCLSSSDGQV